MSNTAPTSLLPPPQKKANFILPLGFHCHVNLKIFQIIDHKRYTYTSIYLRKNVSLYFKWVLNCITKRHTTYLSLRDFFISACFHVNLKIITPVPYFCFQKLPQTHIGYLYFKTCFKFESILYIHSTLIYRYVEKKKMKGFSHMTLC